MNALISINLIAVIDCGLMSLLPVDYAIGNNLKCFPTRWIRATVTLLGEIEVI